MKKIYEKMKKYREELHKIPELGYKEVKTQKYLIEKLEEMGYKPKIICETGLYIYIEGSGEETYAFRSDIDALSIKEETTCEYSSTHDGKMHACGHDGHMAILLGFLKYLKDKKLKKNILAIFQPAEEGPGGAKDIVESGILEKYNVKSIFGLHIIPDLPEGLIGCKSGGLMAKAGQLKIEIKGKAGHGGIPNSGIDSIQVATKLLDGFNLITSKYIGTTEVAVIGIGKINAGTAANIIAETTILEGTLRTLSTPTFETVEKKIMDLSKGLEIAYGVKINVDLANGYPAVINDKELVEVLRNSLEKVEGVTYIEVDPAMAAEDFGFYQEKVKGVFFFLGSRNPKRGFTYSLHNSKFDFSSNVLINGIKVYIALSKELGIE